MSHFTRLKTSIVSLKHLKEALTDLRMEFVEGPVRIRGFAGQTTEVELKVPTRNRGYDLGFLREGQTYELVADWWGIRDLKRDQFVRQLTQRYAYRVAREQLEEQGFTVVEETTEQDQTVHLCVRRAL